MKKKQKYVGIRKKSITLQRNVYLTTKETRTDLHQVVNDYETHFTNFF